MKSVVVRRPIIFAGLPLSSWAFAIRIWLAIVLALYISFWLELEAPSSAALTVAVLALPTRGQVLEKAVFRLIATVIGVAGSIIIDGLFVQTGSLLLVAFAAWLKPCLISRLTAPRMLRPRMSHCWTQAQSTCRTRVRGRRRCPRRV